MTRLYFFIGLLLAATGCKSIELDAASPALLSAVSAETISEIRQVITESLHGRQATIADSVFTNSSKLILQRKQHLDASGNPVHTRVDEAPFVYQLLKQGDSCFIE
ncbi:MAG: hypothetical protein GY784_02190, partial [Gammaproteobacteria bacterium]|nr:hypothetical protein [Gammaproteobacteria bacterium]